MDLSKHSLADLRALHAQIDEHVKVATQKEIANARAEIQAIAQRNGISLQELAKSTVTSKTGKKKLAGSKLKVPAKYRNPEEAKQTWSGRGRQPKWVKEWLETGKSLDALTV